MGAKRNGTDRESNIGRGSRQRSRQAETIEANTIPFGYMEITGIWLWRVYQGYSSLNKHVVGRALGGGAD